jgi:hypothetical protein
MAAVATLHLMVNQVMAQPKCDLLQIAEAYIAKRYPFFVQTGTTPVISDKGGLWEVTYELPEGMLGGAPIISIDKRTCMVVRAQITQ